MTIRPVLIALAILAAPAAAHAASTVYGSGPARDCYEAANSGRTDPEGLADCNTALLGHELSARDRTATMVNRGVIRLQRREADLALQDFETALSWAPNLGEAHVNKGAALILKKDYAAAIESLNRGLELGADDPHEAYFNRGVANEMLNRLPAAYADYRQAQALNPDWELPRAELARFTVAHR